MSVRQKSEEIPITWLKQHFEYRDGFLYRIKSNHSHLLGLAGSPNQAGYWVVKIGNKAYKVHRIIWCLVYGCWPQHNIDHIDNNPANNKIENLRDVTQTINMNNASFTHVGKTGFRGIIQEGKRYVVRFRGKFIGRFSSLEEANACYAFAKEEYHKLLGLEKPNSKPSLNKGASQNG